MRLSFSPQIYARRKNTKTPSPCCPLPGTHHKRNQGYTRHTFEGKPITSFVVQYRKSWQYRKVRTLPLHGVVELFGFHRLHARTVFTP
eukprot:scaffold91466_cov75-Phaeocystis_antarctica.AAC.4